MKSALSDKQAHLYSDSYKMLFLGAFLISCLSAAALVRGQKSSQQYLTATALVTNAQNHSVLQCWRFNSPLIESNTPGTSGALSLALANTTNFSYTVLPPRFDGGLHAAPRKQLVIFIAGLAHLTLPHSKDEAFIIGGKNGLIVAADDTGDGHFTTYPSNDQTIGLQVPFKDNKPPAHRVIGMGPCKTSSQIIPG